MKNLRPARADPKLLKWRRHLDRIEEEITFLAWHKQIYEDVVGIVQSNPRINTHNLFWDWLSRNWVCATLMGIRRQVDSDRRTISLYNLIVDIADNERTLSRQYHVGLYRLGMEGLGNLEFDKLAGARSAHYPSAQATADAEMLHNMSAKFKEYVDRRLAHLDKAKLARIGTYREIYDAVDLLEKIFRKYVLLLTATSVEVVPVAQYEWKDIFRLPWLPASRKPRSRRPRRGP